MVRRNKFRVLFNNSLVSCFVSFVDDEGEVFWVYERWGGSFDLIEVGSELFGRSFKVREIKGLFID